MKYEFCTNDNVKNVMKHNIIRARYQLRQCFFSSGFTTAALNEAGKIQLGKHRLIILTTTLINCSECWMTIFVLKGSNEHVV